MNDIVKELLPLYEDTLKDPDVGMSFQEAYDVENLTPIPEWEEVYRQVKREVTDMGIPLDEF